MLDLAFNNIRRQRTRTFLTVLGIVIGIGAVVALGSITAGLNEEIQSGLELNAGKIMVTQKGSSGFIVGFQGSELTDEMVDEIAGVSGVKEIVPVQYYFERLVPFEGPEWLAIGIVPEKIEFFRGETIGIDEGRDLEEGDEDVIILGKNFAEKWNLEVGDFFLVSDAEMEVVGIVEESGVSDIDDNFIIPLDTLRDITDTDAVPIVMVVPDNLKNTEILAERIEDANEEFNAMTSTDIARQASQIIGQISIFTIGIGAVAALVGGLGIMNTMIMSVLERKREIGVMKAIGATRTKILFHFMTEAFLLSAIGGIAGILLGIIGSQGLGLILGMFRFAAVTPGLIAGGFIFSIFLGLAGGFYPAWKAAKLDPVEALRYE